jgi:hypothetical protein
MTHGDAQAAIAASLDELEKARRMRARIRTPQVRNMEHRQFFQAIALSWFNNHRNPIVKALGATEVEGIDVFYRRMLDATERSSATTTYSDCIRDAKSGLIALRGNVLGADAEKLPSLDKSPDFTPLASDPTMQDILSRRWLECVRCVGSEAYLAATVMMGGLLEALLVARANRLSNKAPLFKAKGAPIDPKTKKPLDLRQWTLGPYIDVAHELGWITKSAKDVAVVLRDYRNYVHPEKERSHGVVLGPDDASMFWELTKTLARQLLQSAATAAPGA